MKALDIACRVCMAQPNWFCGEDNAEGQRGYFNHPERIEDAAAMTRVGDPVSAEQFDHALESTGLV